MGAPSKAVMIPTGSSRGGPPTSRWYRPHEENGAGCGRDRNEPLVEGSNDEAGESAGQEADKADDASGGDGRGRAERGCRNGQGRKSSR